MSIASVTARLRAARDAQVIALTEKGIDVPEGAGFEDFPALIEEIATGGKNQIDDIIAGNLISVESNAEYVVDYAFASNRFVKAVSFPQATQVGSRAFENCTALVSAHFPVLENTSTRMFNGTTPLDNVYMPKLKIVANETFRNSGLKEIPNARNIETLGSGSFSGCTSLKDSCSFDSVTSIGSQCFDGCTSLRHVVLGPNCTTIAGNYAFRGCSGLVALVLLSPVMVPMLFSGMLLNTPIANGTGYIYTHAAVLEEYKEGTNWAIYADQFRAIEDFPEILGGASWLNLQ
jgi:hypothetical protein